MVERIHGGEDGGRENKRLKTAVKFVECFIGYRWVIDHLTIGLVPY
jgi:hypothetical protein